MDHQWRTGKLSGIGSFHHLGLGDKIQVTRLDDTFAPEPSHWLNPCGFGLTLILKDADIFGGGVCGDCIGNKILLIKLL